MNPTFRFGRLAGIPIGANWSVVVITALITWILASSVLPDLAPDQAPAAYLAVAVVAALLFFGSLVLHELAHSVLARRYGVHVRGITLWMLGGVSQLEEETSAASEELRMAAAGPATSFVLGVAFYILCALADALALPTLVVGALWWLAIINIVLGVFNLLPAYPMDGGRILRAALWAHYGDRTRATQASAGAGHFIAYGIIGFGVLMAVSGAFVSGMWLAFIGWYLSIASRIEGTMAVQHDVLGRIPARALMSAPAVTVPADITVADLVDGYILGRHHSAFPVVDAGAPIGLVGLDQVRSLPLQARPITLVRSVAEPLERLAVVAPDDPGSTVLDRLNQTRTRRALVLDTEGRLLGIISSTDLTRALQVAGSRATPSGT